MNHAALSIASPIHLVQPCVFPMPAPSEAPIELSPPLGANNNGKCTTTQNEDAGDWSLDQFPLPFPAPELTQDEPSNGESSAFASGTSQSSGYTKRQHVTEPNEATTPSPPQPPTPKGNSQTQMRTRHQIAAAWWRGINAKRIAKANGKRRLRRCSHWKRANLLTAVPSAIPSAEQRTKSPPVPISPVPSPTMQPSRPPATLVHPLSLANGQCQISPYSSKPSSQPSPVEQMDVKHMQPQFHMPPQFPYQQQLPADMQPIFFHPIPYMYAPMIHTFRSSIDIFGAKSDAANWGTTKMGALTNSENNLTKPLDSAGSLPTTPTTPHMTYPAFPSHPYALAIPFDHSTSTHNTYYITNVNNSTFCANNVFPYGTPTSISPMPTPIPTPTSTPLPTPTSVPPMPFPTSAPIAIPTSTPVLTPDSTPISISPTSIPTSIPSIPASTPTPPPPMPSPFSSPSPVAPSEPMPTTTKHTTNFNFTYNTTYNCYDTSSLHTPTEDKSEFDFDFGADLQLASESAENFDLGDSTDAMDSMDASTSDTSSLSSSLGVERCEEGEHETDEMDEEEEERNDSDSDYEDDGEGHRHRINILVNTGASRPPLVSVRTTMNMRKRNAESATIIETTQTVHTKVHSHNRKSKRDPECPSSPGKEPSDPKDKSKGWKWHEYNAAEPKKRRTTSTYSFTSSPCPRA
eukprot:Phypoly_transcript_04057.p1 GENE.Phypoly_transcript_04057~~Phypoly_transcript_04057.p1  ORF type:complete len:706 (-),score=150.54 Phypoly_transcript_04057:165-2228(-)